MHRILLYIICILLSIAAFACGETHYDSRLTAIAYLLLVLLAVTVFALISAWFSIYNLKKRIGEKEEIMLSLLFDYERLVKLKSEFADQSRKINEINNKTIEAFFSTIKEICSAKNSSEKISATQFSKIRESLFSTIINNDDFWNCIKEIVNSRNKGIITKIEESGQLSEPDLRFLCLVGCGFSNNSIAILSSYTNVHSISNRKRIIADKLQLPSSLDDLFAVSSSDEA